ncbi:MAG TPA: sulfatase/phosphatase domain-containing protein [Solirubrobacterales bacterium]|nr:sulfatase/phosphatase domain-containing protein [Solirubrobacterales bacterium]
MIEVGSHHAADIAPTAIERLGATEEPFFMSVGFFETHRTYRVPTSVRDTLYSLPPANLPDTPETRADMAAFKASARSLDQGIGAVLNGLHQTGLQDSTLVICTTDHGLAFPGAKATLFDRGIGVMLIMRGPGGFLGGRVFDGLVSHLDIYPTLCELAGIEEPPWLQGTSLMPLVRGETDSVNDVLFAEMTYHAAYQPLRAVRSERFKYIRRFGDYDRPVLANCDDSASKAILAEAGWGDQRVPEEQLYDLLFDPNELNDLSAEPSHEATLMEMRERLLEWMRATEDPLLDGPVPEPPGAWSNDPAQASPNDPTSAAER